MVLERFAADTMIVSDLVYLDDVRERLYLRQDDIPRERECAWLM